MLTELAFALTCSVYCDTMPPDVSRRLHVARLAITDHIQHVYGAAFQSAAVGPRALSSAQCPLSILAWACGHAWASTLHRRHLPEVEAIIANAVIGEICEWSPEERNEATRAAAHDQWVTVCYQTGALMAGDMDTFQATLTAMEMVQHGYTVAMATFVAHVGAVLEARNVALAGQLCAMARTRRGTLFRADWQPQVCVAIVRHTVGRQWLDGFRAMHKWVAVGILPADMASAVPSWSSCDWTAFEKAVDMTNMRNSISATRLFDAVFAQVWSRVNVLSVMTAGSGETEAWARAEANVLANVRHIEERWGVRLQNAVSRDTVIATRFVGLLKYYDRARDPLA